MTDTHGSRYRYKQGCRCSECRDANRAYVTRWKTQRPVPAAPRVLVDASGALAHVERLHEAGMSYGLIAAAAGMPRQSLRDLQNRAKTKGAIRADEARVTALLHVKAPSQIAEKPVMVTRITPPPPDPTATTWHGRSACRLADPSHFDGDGDEIAHAYCLVCTVRDACLDEALALDVKAHMIDYRAGMTAEQRATEYRRRQRSKGTADQPEATVVTPESAALTEDIITLINRGEDPEWIVAKVGLRPDAIARRLERHGAGHLARPFRRLADQKRAVA